MLVMGMLLMQEDEHGPDGAYLHPSLGGEAMTLSSSLAEEDVSDAELSEFGSHASMGTPFLWLLSYIAL